jgi:TPR repeat protein
VLFHEAMEQLKLGNEDAFVLFEKAAARGHEESLWILKVFNSVGERESNACKEAFAQSSGEGLASYLAGIFCGGRERFDFYQKSAEGGCSWGQLGYARYFLYGGHNVEKDEKVYLEWLEKAVNQNNPAALHKMGLRLLDELCLRAARTPLRTAAALGWTQSIKVMANLHYNDRDFLEAAIWSAKAKSVGRFEALLEHACAAWEGRTEGMLCDAKKMHYSLGWGLYWYIYGTDYWNDFKAEDKLFSMRCLDYYCSCVELQQKSILTFLMFWNRTAGVKEVGVMIGKRVWEEREDNLVKSFSTEELE